MLASARITAEQIALVEHLVMNPSESLTIEVKTWLDLSNDDEKANLLRAIAALRNHNGGHIVIGFDNASLQPDETRRPADIAVHYHIDFIQPLVAKYLSELFEIGVATVTREGNLYPVITIPSGVRTPVSVRRDLGTGTKAIKEHEIYVRTLRANHKPSSSKARHQDWGELMQHCFDNREADIGSFLRRHLGSFNPEVLREFAAAISDANPTRKTDEELAKDFLHESEARYATVKQEKPFDFPEHGTWEVALVIQGEAPSHELSEVLSLLRNHNPSYSGWPVWMDPSNLDKERPPFVFNGLYEALVVSNFLRNSIDYMRVDPRGKFFLLRSYDDDTSTHERAPAPLTSLDIVVPIWRTAEAIGVGLALARGWGFSSENSTLNFLFKWTRLSGRRLISWREYRWDTNRGKSSQDTVESFVQVPLDTPESAISGYVAQVLGRLFEVFDAAKVDEASIAHEVNRALKQKR
jgi:hypothetical protein